MRENVKLKNKIKSVSMTNKTLVQGWHMGWLETKSRKIIAENHVY